MFLGTINKRDVSKAVLIETHYIERFDMEYLPKGCFSIVIMKNGSITAKVSGTDCYFVAPIVICLNEHKDFTLTSGSASDVRIINFDPQFLNVNMKIDTLRSSRYKFLCQQHAFFQLSPFLTENISKISFRLSDDTMKKIESSFGNLTRNIIEQSDWYWSCRARSYFIDIINILERIYHNYYIEEDTYDICVKAAISNEFKSLISYVNNHLDEKITLQLLYNKFRINKNQIEDLFKEYLNITFYDYLKTRRYEEASYYLRFTELDGEQIASRIGLSSSQNFCKFFKSLSGMSPNEFRKVTVSKRKNDDELLELIKPKGFTVL